MDIDYITNRYLSAKFQRALNSSQCFTKDAEGIPIRKGVWHSLYKRASYTSEEFRKDFYDQTPIWLVSEPVWDDWIAFCHEREKHVMGDPHPPGHRIGHNPFGIPQVVLGDQFDTGTLVLTTLENLEACDTKYVSKVININHTDAMSREEMIVKSDIYRSLDIEQHFRTRRALDYTGLIMAWGVMEDLIRLGGVKDKDKDFHAWVISESLWSNYTGNRKISRDISTWSREQPLKPHDQPNPYGMRVYTIPDDATHTPTLAIVNLELLDTFGASVSSFAHSFVISPSPYGSSK